MRLLVVRAEDSVEPDHQLSMSGYEALQVRQLFCVSVTEDHREVVCQFAPSPLTDVKSPRGRERIGLCYLQQDERKMKLLIFLVNVLLQVSLPPSANSKSLDSKVQT